MGRDYRDRDSRDHGHDRHHHEKTHKDFNRERDRHHERDRGHDRNFRDHKNDRHGDNDRRRNRSRERNFTHDRNDRNKGNMHQEKPKPQIRPYQESISRSRSREKRERHTKWSVMAPEGAETLEEAKEAQIYGAYRPINMLQNMQKSLFDLLIKPAGEDEKTQEIAEASKAQILTLNNSILRDAGMNMGTDEENLIEQELDYRTIVNKYNACTTVFAYTPGVNPNLIATLNDTSKIKRKIYIPIVTSFNYTGLIIGPKGANQKRLEEETNCKILVRGKGSQKEGAPPQPDDHEPLHVLIVGDTEIQVARAISKIERIIFANEDTRNLIRQEQLKIVATLKNDPMMVPSNDSGYIDLSLTTPYGPPSQDATIIPVPNDCVGLVIGKGGETIKLLQYKTGARKVQVAADSAPGTNSRNVFVEGTPAAIEKVRLLLSEIVESQLNLKQAMDGILPNNQEAVRVEISVPNSLVGLVIGRGGETIKLINQKTGAYVYIPKECEPGKDCRTLIITGGRGEVRAAKIEGQRNLALKVVQDTGYIPLQPYIQNTNLLETAQNSADQGTNSNLDPLLMSIMQQQKIYQEAPEIEEKVVTEEIIKPKYVKKRKDNN